MQATALSLLYVPAAHVAGVAAPAGQYEPAVQLVHEALPGATKEPSGQARQVEASGEGTEPASQSPHCVEPSPLIFPLGHANITCPTEGQKKPAGQGVQELLLAGARKPDAHGIGALAPHSQK